MARWYWSFKQQITYKQFDLIDWNIIARVMEDNRNYTAYGFPSIMQTGAGAVRIWFDGSSRIWIYTRVVLK